MKDSFGKLNVDTFSFVGIVCYFRLRGASLA